MGTVSIPNAMRLSDDWHALTAEHRGIRVGPWRERAVCTGCGVVMTWVPGPFLVTHEGVDHEVPGYYVGPPDDTEAHMLIPGLGQDDTSQQPATPAAAPAGRPAGLSPTAPSRSKDTPSNRPEARHAQYERAKRRRARANL